MRKMRQETGERTPGERNNHWFTWQISVVSTETSTVRQDRAVIRGEFGLRHAGRKVGFAGDPEAVASLKLSWLHTTRAGIEGEESRGSFRSGEFIRTETSLPSLYCSTMSLAILLAWETHRCDTQRVGNSGRKNEVKANGHCISEVVTFYLEGHGLYQIPGTLFEANLSYRNFWH